MYTLDGKVALVTGAARGIGRAIALRLASEGASVVVNDVNEVGVRGVADEIERQGQRALALPADVTSADEVEAMIQRTVGELGRLDIAVANAGIIVISPLLDMGLDDWDRLFDVNVKAVWLTSAAAARQMVSQGQGGRLILAASRAGKGPSRLGLTGAYSTTKHAVVGLTRALSVELAPHQITVNAYCPGAVDTDMWDKIDREGGARFGKPPGQLKAEALGQIPLGRLESPDDVANLVAWLASDQSSYMTGQAINIEGGGIFH
jgi:meso-butanediol dehydrogenase / (S,S)-butanediol dehydrogenase / diacetyl reductase